MFKPQRPIFFVAQDGFDLPTARVRCYGFAHQLAQRGFSTTILSYRDDLHASRHGVELPLMSRWEQIELNFRAFARLMKSPDRPILYVQKVNYHCLAPKLAAAMRHLPLVVDFDDLEYQLERPNCWQNRLIRHFLRYARACVAGSHHLCDWLKNYNSNVYLVYTGVDTSVFTPPPNESQRISRLETPTVIWTGGVFDDITSAAIRGVLDFFGVLNRIDPRTRLHVLAYGSRLPQVGSMIQEHPARKHITLTPNVSPREVPGWLNQAHAGLFFFPTITPWVKAKSPTKLFEYMACGVVPVCGRGTEADHVVTHGQDGIIFDQTRDGAEQLAHMFGSLDSWSAYSSRARQKAMAEFGLSEQVGGLVRLFQMLDTPAAADENDRVSRWR